MFHKLGLEPFGPVPNDRHMEWYRRGKTAFLHFTVNTFTDREWGDGTESPAVFAPTELDCRQWLRVLRDAGFTAAILTAKHHDGFCLWPSKYTEHSVKNSPCQVDVVGEFTAACREFGIKAGIYLSPWDRNHPQWGTEAYNDYYANQLTELMTQYGPIWECWWDGAGSTQARYDWKRWADIVRKHQPQCVIFGCLGAAEYVDVRWVGNESGTAGEPCYATIDPETVVVEDTAVLNSGKWGGSRFIPAETNTSIRPGWFYHASQDDQVKTPEELVEYWFRSAGRNSAILLNLPPDRRGLIHQRDAENAIAWQGMLEKIFETDLAAGAKITAPEGIAPGCGAEKLLLEEDTAIYAPKVRTPEVELTFGEPVTFDCFRVDEVIELGHRVRRFALEAWENGGWRRLLDRMCIGFCHCERFDPVTTDRVRLRILQADADPVLRMFRLYNSRGIGLGGKEKEKTGELTGLQIQREPEGIVVDLGGIYPYNQVDVAAEGVVEIQAFNGTRYVPVYSGPGGVCRFDAVTGSYKLKITGQGVQADTQVRVYYV